MKNVYKTLKDKELIELYKKSKNSQDVIDSMVERYQPLLMKIAHQHTRKHKNSSFEDNFQNAKIGLILACQRYNSLSEAKFSSYLYKTVFHYLTTCSEEESFVKCPSSMREVKSFLGNKYELDQLKSNHIKEKYQLNTKDDIMLFRKKFNLLNPDSVITEDNWVLENISVDRINDFTNDALFNVFYDSLDNQEQLIVKLVCIGYSCPEIVRVFSENGKDITEKQIRSMIKKLKSKFV